MGLLCCAEDSIWKALPLIPILVLFVLAQIIKPKKKSINGKHVFITGGSSGIGYAAAVDAIKEGAKVTIIARNKDRLQEAQTKLDEICTSQANGSKVQHFSVDLSGDEDKIVSVVHEAEATFGPIYMLVNNAGFSVPGKFEDIPLRDAKKMMDIHFTGSFILTQEVVRSMKKNEVQRDSDSGGIIVFVSSQGGLFGFYGFTAYSATKGALIKMAEALHMELKPYNISVTVSLPPDTDTPGFVEENKNKPVETALISASAGLFEPKDVSNKLMKDALDGRFFSTIGFEGFMLVTMCAGMGPITHLSDFMAQVFLSGLFRSISAFYLWSFGNIVKGEHNKRISNKKLE